MPSALDSFNEAFQRASNPVNPPAARPSALDVSSLSSSLAPSLAAHWHDESRFTPPNTAIDSTHVQCHSPNLRPDDATISHSQHTWTVETPMQRSHEYNRPQIFSESEADFHQEAMTFEGTSQMLHRNECPSPQQANTTLTGEPAQSKAAAADELFSEADDNEMPDLETSTEDDNMFEVSGLGQTAQNSIKQESGALFHKIPGIGQTTCDASLADTRDYADPISHPSPTESLLVAEGFEFHNELSEDVQINRFNDKAFRKALREVQLDLPRKQQWYAWSKAKQMLDGEPASAVTEQMERGWRAPLERQNLNQHEREQEDGIWGLPAQPVSLGAVIHRRSVEEHNTVDRQLEAQVPRQGRPSSLVSTGGSTVGNDPWHGSIEAQNHGDWTSSPQRIDQDRLSAHPLGKLISKLAEEHQARRESKDRSRTAYESGMIAPDLTPPGGNDSAAATVNAKKNTEIQSLQTELQNVDDEVVFKIEQVKHRILARRGDSAHGLLPHSNGDEHDRAIHGTKQVETAPGPNPISHPTVHLGLPSHLSSAGTPPLPPRPSIERSTSHLRTSTSMHDADLIRPHANTLIRRSPSLSLSRRHGHGHLPRPISPNRRSPSPWIEHPGINRPDTPRPGRPVSDTDIRASVEPETPYSQRVRERQGTPAYSNRSPSPSPSPVSHLGTSYTNANAHEDDTEMTDAPATSQSATPTRKHNFPQISSPDPLSSPFLHGGNTVTAPSTPLPSLNPSKTRRKSIGGQPSKPNTKHRSATTTTTAAAVQGSNISKSRKVTQVAQKFRKEATKKTIGGGSGGNKVADAVRKIEEGIKAVVEGSPRRSGRIAAGKGRKK